MYLSMKNWYPLSSRRMQVLLHTWGWLGSLGLVTRLTFLPEVTMSRNCFLDFAVERWFGYRTTEPGFVGDIGAIQVWLIDWYSWMFKAVNSGRRGRLGPTRLWECQFKWWIWTWCWSFLGIQLLAPHIQAIFSWINYLCVVSRIHKLLHSESASVLSYRSLCKSLIIHSFLQKCTFIICLDYAQNLLYPLTPQKGSSVDVKMLRKLHTVGECLHCIVHH